MKIKVKQIEIVRAEGPIDLCDKPETVNSFAEANRVLFRWSTTAPKEGGYDKCDFKVLYEDGAVYDGRYDLKHHAVETPDLSKHIADYQGFYAGTSRPAHLSEEKYLDFLSKVGSEARESAKEFLAKYEVR